MEIPAETTAEPFLEAPVVAAPKLAPPAAETGIKVSALSLASIRAKRELEQSHKAQIKDTVHLPTEPFTETDMLLQWNKYAQRLSDRGHKIMESLLLLNDPKLEGTTIIHELPNEGSKIDFESEKHELVGYLRGKLHNHDIDIKIVVNESMDNKKAFTPQDRYNRLNEINPALELLRKTFDLDI
ncbi:MAG TPA: DNA polymerase III subunit gamma/tau [Flavobacterium sp.]|nr:DNA polymerase III subunit gamma/tau [Flavobacterium sp.]